MGCRFTATTDGYSQCCFGDAAQQWDTSTMYIAPGASTTSMWNATETAVDWAGGVSTITLRDLRQRWDNPNSIILTLRKNSAGTALTCATSSSSTASDTTHTVTLGSGDTWAFQRTGDTGFIRTGHFACVLDAASSYGPTGSPWLYYAMQRGR
jgi:hypothetical protein